MITGFQTSVELSSRPAKTADVSRQGLGAPSPPAGGDVDFIKAAAAGRSPGDVAQADPANLAVLRDAVQKTNTFIEALRRDLVFQVDEATDRLVVKVVDKASGEVVRQMPSEEMLDLIKHLDAQAESSPTRVGLLLKSQA